MIIAISGKIESGKDTVGKIIQYLTHPNKNITITEWLNGNCKPNLIGKLKNLLKNLNKLYLFLQGVQLKN